MNDDLLQDIWDRGPEERKMTRAEIETLLRPQLDRSARSWNILMWTYAGFIALTLVCEGMILYAFRTNGLVLSIGIMATLATLGFLAYGVRILRTSAAIDEADEDLVSKLRRKLHFHRTQFERWLWMIAVTFVFLSLAVSTLADVEDGQYRINQPLVFAGIVVGQLFFGYGAVKIGLYPMTREVKAILNDLENQVIHGTEAVLESKRAWRKWGIALTIALTASAVYGLYRAMG